MSGIYYPLYGFARIIWVYYIIAIYYVGLLITPARKVLFIPVDKLEVVTQ
jgi:hypothetical protein